MASLSLALRIVPTLSDLYLMTSSTSTILLPCTSSSLSPGRDKGTAIKSLVLQLHTALAGSSQVPLSDLERQIYNTVTCRRGARKLPGIVFKMYVVAEVVESFV